MNVRLRYFASVREAMGQGAETLQTSAATLAALPAIVHGIRARGLRLVSLEPGTGPIAAP